MNQTPTVVSTSSDFQNHPCFDFTPEELVTLQRKWHIHNPDSSKEVVAKARNNGSLVEGLLPRQSLDLLVGDSGLGKSPLQYQLAICVAAGIPFLGFPVKRGPVLYLDYENGRDQANNIVDELSKFLGLAEPPKNLLMWNYNDCSVPVGKVGHTHEEMLRDTRPSLVFVDSITAMHPEIEKENWNVTPVFQKFRRWMQELTCNIFGTHHLRKESWMNKRQALEDAISSRQWLQNARGAGALINASDVRLAIDASERVEFSSGKSREAALIIRGFRRVFGEICALYIGRVYDDVTGEPSGYERVAGVDLLSNDDHRRGYEKLPEVFRFMEAKQIYGKGPQATVNFLNACVSMGILEKTATGYQKIHLV